MTDTLLRAAEIKSNFIRSFVVAIGFNEGDVGIEIEAIATDSESIFQYATTADIEVVDLLDAVCPGM